MQAIDNAGKGSFVAGVIAWSTRNAFIVLALSLALAAAGILSLRHIPLDAVPDLTDTQVIVRTEWQGQAPQVIEDQVTFPLSSRFLSLPRAKTVRGVSMPGDSFVYIIFEEGTDIYWARSRVQEALAQITEFPEGARPAMGPDATGTGWIFQYALVSADGKTDLAGLRDLQDWFVRYELATVRGVAEIATVGGQAREYQVQADPEKLRFHGIPLADVATAVREASGEAGGRTLEMGAQQYLIRSLGYVKNVEDLKLAVLASRAGVPVTLGDVADIVEGPAWRSGIADLDGRGEVVGGIVVMRPGANALDVISAVKARLETVRQGLPAGVELRVVYDRSLLVGGAIDYLRDKLVEESIAVALVTFLFLMHARSALAALAVLPLGILAAFIVMKAAGVTANIMSLGGIAIAIGAMVDAAIVMVENAHRRLAEDGGRSPRHVVILSAAQEVGPSLFFSLLVITVSFLPVFALTGQSLRLFAPLALTKTLAMAAACLLSVTLVPVLMLLLIRGRVRPESESGTMRRLAAGYGRLLVSALHHRRGVLALSLALLLATAVPVARLGTEFMPSLDEGSLLYMPMTLPGLTPGDARETLQATNRMLRQIPEVRQVFGKAGRSDSATDPAPLQMLETWIDLKPRSEWRKGMTMEKLKAEMEHRVRLPGLRNAWGYPVKIRMDMVSTGLRTPVGVRVAGSDLAEIGRIAGEVEQAALRVKGTRSAIAERAQGGRYVEIVPDRAALARFGIRLGAFQDVVRMALGGETLAETVDGRKRYPLALRLERGARDSIDDLGQIYVQGEGGAQVPLAELADIRVTSGPAMISSENARLNGLVFIDADTADLGGYVGELQAALNKIPLPAGYTLHVTGQYDQMLAANARLALAVPACLLLIVALLYLHFGRWDRTLLVLLAVPFGLIGGFWGVWLAGYSLSVAVSVGFIALAGIAVETAVVMLVYIDRRMEEAPPEDEAAFLDNIRYGAALRLRPKLMTVSVIVLGLVPIFLTTGPGSDVMRHIALPMLSGMASTTVLTLLVLPVVYARFFKGMTAS